MPDYLHSNGYTYSEQEVLNAAKKKKCDIRCKYDIRPLTNMNLIMDDLAEVAYFVKEIQK